MPREKIQCTLGPATDPPGVVPALVEAGLDAMRINFSHGGKVMHRPRVEQGYDEDMPVLTVTCAPQADEHSITVVKTISDAI